MSERKPVAISAKQARHLALGAQGFEAEDGKAVDARRIMKMIRKTGLLQIDSVNVLSRAHYMPVFSRLGVYDRDILDQLSWGPKSRRRLFEYWGHEASLIPLEDYPLFRWRMENARSGDGMWGGIARVARDHPEFVRSILDDIAAKGPMAASDMDAERPASGSKWWGWSRAKTALEYLFWSGQLAARTRRSSFERVYDLPERVVGADFVAQQILPRDVAQRALLRKAIAAMGVATTTDLRKYFRIPTDDAKQRIAEMAEAGELIPADVQGWSQPGWIAPDAKLRRRAIPSALLVPFDPVMWDRDRVERIFGFTYRIEIYTPAPKRQYGYYVLPFMQNGAMVARVDLKADRQEGLLRVVAAHIEPGCVPGEVAPDLHHHLHRLAVFLGLEDVDIAGVNDFSRYLAGLKNAA
ncbi:MAG: crosslink repair DNA glycosylase YcaQ family protein [Pseudomonadota bacterium]